MPWMQNGTILKHLQGEGPLSVDIDRCVCIFVSSWTLSKPDEYLHQICEVAQGIDYLHLQNIVHGDLRGVRVI